MKFDLKQKHWHDTRKYTLMLVPHEGKAHVFSMKIPMQTVKYIAAAAGAAFITLAAFCGYYGRELYMASADKQELAHLRQINNDQKQKIEELSHKTSTLQQDMDKLNQLELDIRKMISAEDSQQTSRSSDRPSLGFTGQGGPAPVLPIDELAAVLDSIQTGLDGRETTLMALRDQLVNKRAQKAHMPSIWPAHGDITSRFGGRSSPFGGGSDYHPGIDIANSYGTPIEAAADGTVVYSGWNAGGYGNLVQIDHGNGIETLYGHCSSVAVQVGQSVHKGMVVAYMGSTGYSTGSHVHYEVRLHGSAVDPSGFLNN